MELQKFMTTLAQQAGENARQMQGALSSDDINTKSSDRDLVSAADKATELLIRDTVTKAFPEFGFFGEETGKSDLAGKEFCWVVDPIDGTTPFLHGELFWCTSIGLFRNGKPYAGAVYAPMLNELYYAEAGKGATVNGQPIHTRNHGKLRTSVVATGFSCVRAGWEENNLRFFDAISMEARGVRRFGSAALDCCGVARGRLDAFWELNLNPYDIAAGAIIVLEAGGVVSDLSGGDQFPQQGFIVSNTTIYPEMLSFFKDYKRPV